MITKGTGGLVLYPGNLFFPTCIDESFSHFAKSIYKEDLWKYEYKLQRENINRGKSLTMKYPTELLEHQNPATHVSELCRVR